MVIAAGAAALLVYLVKKEMRFVLPLSSVPLHRGEKCAAYLFTPPMVLALAMMVWSTRYYINVPFSTRSPRFFSSSRLLSPLFTHSARKRPSAPHPTVKGGYGYEL